MVISMVTGLTMLVIYGVEVLKKRVHGRTAEHAADAALRVSEEQYRQIVENANDIIFIVDREGYCVSMNRAGQKVTGYAASDSRGTHVSRLVAPEHAEMAQCQLRRALDGEVVPVFEIDIISSTGHRRTLELNVRGVSGAAGIGYVQGIARDVTERKEIEARLRQAQKMEAIGQLAGGVAHDFNNMLTVIIGCTELVLQQLEPDNPARADLDQIYQTATGASSLVRQLLIFGRKSTVRPTVLDVNEIVPQVSTMLRRLIGENIELIVRPAAGDARIEADGGQIEQVIMNLAINARDAMPTGGTLTIEIASTTADETFARTHHVSIGARFITMVVGDTGIGMTTDVQARIFEPFFTTKGPTKGTGLGLATVHEIVRRAGGIIAVRSAPGRGASFTIHWPRVDAPVERGHEPPVHPEPTVVQGATILFVEDDDGIRSLSARLLRRRGYIVMTARHAVEAIAIADRAGRIDLLFTDVVLPGVDGRTLAERLQRERPSLKVLYTSGYGEHSTLLNDLDPAAYLQKPYTPASLVMGVGQALSS
jgi:two-component system, cell cycle sensor histidine kinase and response regulator CckA